MNPTNLVKSCSAGVQGVWSAHVSRVSRVSYDLIMNSTTRCDSTWNPSPSKNKHFALRAAPLTSTLLTGQLFVIFLHFVHFFQQNFAVWKIRKTIQYAKDTHLSFHKLLSRLMSVKKATYSTNTTSGLAGFGPLLQWISQFGSQSADGALCAYRDYRLQLRQCKGHLTIVWGLKQLPEFGINIIDCSSNAKCN